MKILLIILVFGLTLQGTVVAAASEALKTLHSNVCKIVGLREDSTVGSVEFNNSAFKKFSEIGPRDKMVTSMMNESKNSGIFLRIFYDNSFLSFQWTGHDSSDEKNGGCIYYATIKIRLDEQDKLRSLTSSIGKESFPPSDLAPFDTEK